MKYLTLRNTALLFSFMALAACQDNSRFDAEIPFPTVKEEEEEDKKDEEMGTSSYNELYRPQIHYTPAKNWINDPNGMVYADGVYHLFYQYNPKGNDWGNMSWGHATSTNLIEWEEQAVALERDALGDVFSGSAVCDAENTAGFGKGAIVALYTSSGSHQQQSLAYSTDGGKSFVRYDKNPIIANSSEADFLDPKVFWHKETNQWIMALAKGWKYEIEFWGSADLKNWTKLSAFSTPISACNKGQWECPDLLRMSYQGKDKWVLIVSVNPGGPVSGSGTQYFIGDFDGTSFVADERNYPLWLDYGMDNYAGVTWSNVEGRQILIGWMNNWNYAGAVPANPWRSAMTLPRELKLIEWNSNPILASTVVQEIDEIAGEWQDITSESLGMSDAYQLKLEVDITKKSTIILKNSVGEYLEMSVNAATRQLITHRTGKTGQYSFAGNFSIPSIKSPFNTDGDKVVLDIFVDRSSVEVFTENGSMVQTNLVFPNGVYNQLIVEGQTVNGKVRELKSIW